MVKKTKEEVTLNSNWILEGFWKIIDDCGLVELDLIGYQYTWERGRGTNGWVEVRLDRTMTNMDWVDRFRSAHLFNLEVSLLDHCPLFLDPEFKQRGVANRSFRFENAWLTGQ